MSEGKSDFSIEEFYISMEKASQLNTNPYVFFHELWFKYFDQRLDYYEFRRIVLEKNSKYKILFKQRENPAIIKKSFGIPLSPKDTEKIGNVMQDGGID